MARSKQSVRVRLAVYSDPPCVIEAAAPDFNEEIAAHAHLHVTEFRWEAEKSRLVVELEEEDIGWDLQRTAAGMQEELLEIVPAVADLSDFREVRCDILDIQVVTLAD